MYYLSIASIYYTYLCKSVAGENVDKEGYHAWRGLVSVRLERSKSIALTRDRITFLSEKCSPFKKIKGASPSQVRGVGFGVHKEFLVNGVG